MNIDYLLQKESLIIDQIQRLDNTKSDIAYSLTGISHLVGNPMIDNMRSEFVELSNEIDSLKEELRVLRVDIGCVELNRFFGEDYPVLIHNLQLLWVNRSTQVKQLVYNPGLQYGYREPKPIEIDYNKPASPYVKFDVYEYQFQMIVKDNVKYIIGGNEEANKVIIS